MKLSATAALAVLSVSLLGLPIAQAASSTDLANPKNKLSYAIGMDIGMGFKNQNIDVDPQLLMQGMKDVISGNKTLLTQAEVHDTLVNFQKQLIAKREADFKQINQKNVQDGSSYMQTNKAKPGVVTLANGLQYKVIKQGAGPMPADTDIVMVNYAGSFINGKIFDSSYQRGKPVSFPVTDVIPGWTQALKMMKVGSVWELTVPPQLGYGQNGMPPIIGPNQTLIFKIELLGTKKKA